MEKSNQIIIVSGLPRSGTSLMMQMLSAAGFSLFSDEERKPDIHNPVGYHEHKRVKNISVDNSWIYAAQGKVVKIVSPLLFNLPGDLFYKIIFMQRDLYETIISQNKMIADKFAQAGQPDRDEIKRHYLRHLAAVERWLKNSQNLDYVYINFNELIEHPLDEAAKIKGLFHEMPDIEKMATVVKPSLYRTKKRTDPRTGQPS